MHLELPRFRSLLTAALLLIAVLPARAVQVPLVADAHVNRALPAVNSGSISNLNVGAGYTSLIQFDLSVLPGGTTASQVSKAVLMLYCNRANTPGTLALQPVNGGWGEYSLTYGTLPALGGAAQSVAVSQAGAYIAIDVTAQVQGWITAPATNNGLALSSAAADLQFDSKENDQTGHGPALDISLVNSGPTGPQGVPGPAGLQGPQGLQGVAGVPGLAGPAGASGASGPAGPQGLQGIAGAAGLIGPTGAAGSPGAAGPVGPVGLRFKGAFIAGQLYASGDGVLYGGAGYVSLADGNVGNAPDRSPLQWSQFASGGAGPAGPAGPQGLMGFPGAPGAPGAAGVPGAAGTQGPAGIRYRGAWTSNSSYQITDSVTFNGSTYLAQAASYSQQPNLYPNVWAVLAAGVVGPAGPSGPTGPGASVSVGSVTTGPPGSSAAVTNTGTASSAVFNFTIPQGATGAGGGAGAPGGTDVSAASVYHSISNSFLYYSVTSGNFSGGNDTAQVLTWVPDGCVASKLKVYSQQGQQITVRLRLGQPAAMSDTGLVCVVAPNSSCTAIGNVAVPAGGFIDLSALGATGTPSPVWTALTCN